MSERDGDLSMYGGSASSVKFYKKGGAVKLLVLCSNGILFCQYTTVHV